MSAAPAAMSLPQAPCAAVTLRDGRARVAPAAAGAALDAALAGWLREIEPGATARVRSLMAGFWNLYPATAALQAAGLYAALELELRKAYAESGDVPREAARRIVARLREQPGSPCVVPPDLADAGLLAFELGQGGRPGFGRGLKELACAAFALASVYGGVLASALRREPHRLPADAAPLYAVHAEDATRTRPLWRLVKKAGAPATVLVLGRPFGAGQSLRDAAAVAAKQGLAAPSLRLLRPASLGAALAATPALLRALYHTLRATRAFALHAGWPLPPRMLAACCYRMAWGRVHQAWLRRQGTVPAQVVFGHTGIGDTSLLEQALQARGARTSHLLHGVVNGQYLDGISDLAHCQCGADAASLAGWSAYRQLRHSPAPKPACRAPGAAPAWLLLTNLLHPIAADYRRFGPRSELRLLQQVAAACGLLGLDPAQVCWKPHPTFELLPAAVRQAMLAAVRGHGFSEWPQGRPFADAAGAAVILCTISTTYLDMLRLGRAAMLYDALPWDRSQFAEWLPADLRAGAPADLAALYRRLAAPAGHARAFDAAWDALGPGEPDPAPAQVLP